jgi:hypothetical protein
VRGEPPPRLGVFAPDLLRRLAFLGGGQFEQLSDRDVALADGLPNDAFGLGATRLGREAIDLVGAKGANPARAPASPPGVPCEASEPSDPPPHERNESQAGGPTVDIDHPPRPA